MFKERGFTLLELLVAIAIIGLLAAIIVPNLRYSKPKEVRENFFAQLNILTGFAWQNAIRTKKTQRVTFNPDKKEVKIMIETGTTDKYGVAQYEPLRRAKGRSSIKMPEQLDIKTFFIDGIEQMSTARKSIGADIDFFVSEGLSQFVIINFTDKLENGRPFGLVMNPFSAQFEVYDEFKKP